MNFKLATTVLVILKLNLSQSLKLNECENDNFVDISQGTRFTNGDVYFEGVKYDKSEYYIDKNTGMAKGCLCTKQKCIRKCCPFGQGYNGERKVCENVTDVFAPPVWDEYRLMKSANASQIFLFNFGKMNCSANELRVRIGQASDGFHLKLDGKLFIEMPGSIPPWMVRGPDKYCIDTFVLSDELGNRKTQLDALVCFAEDNFDTTSYYMSSTCMLISCVFILATVAVYAWLPELRNLHGRVLMAYLCCLFVGFLFFAIMQLLLVANNIGTSSCLIFTFIIYFSLLSGFFWLNVMSFDIWWTFSGKRGTSLEKLSTRARFIAYATYAFGVPTGMTIVLAGLEFSGLPRHPLLPNIKHQGCFIFGTSKLIYFYAPIAILCIANSVFFILTAVRIARIKQQTAMLQSKESATHDQHNNDRQRLLLYVKLFAVMGINWLLEVVSGIYPEAQALWRYTDAYNVLIGLIIFIIFVCKRKIFRLIKKRFEEYEPLMIILKSNSNDEERIIPEPNVNVDKSDVKTLEKVDMVDVETSENVDRYRQLRGRNLSRTQTSSSRTVSTSNDIRLSNIKSNGNSNSAANFNSAAYSNSAANFNSAANNNLVANSNLAANPISVANFDSAANNNSAANITSAANSNLVSHSKSAANSNSANNFNKVSNLNSAADINLAENCNSALNSPSAANNNSAGNCNSVTNSNSTEKSSTEA